MTRVMWFVFLLSSMAYAPLMYGIYLHPEEGNLASYSVWLLLSGALLYSSCKLNYAGWPMSCGWFVGIILTLGFMVWRGGYTYNLDANETRRFYGICLALILWILYGFKTGMWKPRALYLGCVFVDVISFYPLIKQYTLPHEAPTKYMVLAYGMWLLGAVVNVLWVERMPQRLLAAVRSGASWKERWRILEESLLSLENTMFLATMLIIMVV
jgi:hypothetical protein